MWILLAMLSPASADCSSLGAPYSTAACDPYGPGWDVCDVVGSEVVCDLGNYPASVFPPNYLSDLFVEKNPGDLTLYGHVTDATIPYCCEVAKTIFWDSLVIHGVSHLLNTIDTRAPTIDDHIDLVVVYAGNAGNSIWTPDGTLAAHVYGGSAVDRIYGGSSLGALHGGGENDWIAGGDQSDLITGDDGADVISDLGGDNDLLGGDGNDTIVSSSGNDLIVGGVGDDVLVGGGGADSIYGDCYTNGVKVYPSFFHAPACSVGGNDPADDFICADEHSGGWPIPVTGCQDVNVNPDLVCGGPGDDEAHGGPGNDRLDGQAGNDFTDGGPGNDKCADYLFQTQCETVPPAYTSEPDCY